MAETEVAAEGQVAQETQEAAEGAPVEGSVDAASKSFTQEQVNGIISERLKGWQKYGKPEEVESRFKRLEQLEQFVGNMRQQFSDGRSLPGQQAQAPETEADKQVRAYMERMYPELKTLRQSQEAYSQQIQHLDAFRWQVITDRSNGYLSNVMKSAGYQDSHFEKMAQMVVNSISANPQDHQHFLRTGDLNIVKKHFDAVDAGIKSFGFAAPAAVPVAAARAQTGVRAGKLPPRMPAAGVPAPTSKPASKLGDKERIDAAFAKFKEGMAA